MDAPRLRGLHVLEAPEAARQAIQKAQATNKDLRSQVSQLLIEEREATEKKAKTMTQNIQNELRRQKQVVTEKDATKEKAESTIQGLGWQGWGRSLGLECQGWEPWVGVPGMEGARGGSARGGGCNKSHNLKYLWTIKSIYSRVYRKSCHFYKLENLYLRVKYPQLFVQLFSVAVSVAVSIPNIKS